MNNFTNKISFSRQRVDWFSNMLVCKYWGENLQVAKTPSGCQLQKPLAEEGGPHPLPIPIILKRKRRRSRQRGERRGRTGMSRGTVQERGAHVKLHKPLPCFYLLVPCFSPRQRVGSREWESISNAISVFHVVSSLTLARVRRKWGVITSLPIQASHGDLSVGNFTHGFYC